MANYSPTNAFSSDWEVHNFPIKSYSNVYKPETVVFSQPGGIRVGNITQEIETIYVLGITPVHNRSDCIMGKLTQ